ncbi:DUF1772 domain-containing protein [Nodosilinea nodulosa]|uniref:anthrone oxygenase family protein n=1 Tax=Nodosilinea nodulosa TaxID=416001 RepID=UPI0002D5142C|nr:anthrone oxygenase family protein [Nodosilinea nodulosa]
MATLNTWRVPLVMFAAIASALTAGVFLAFSTFVMQALARQPAATAIATMQAINITVINPWFMTVFLGPGVACLGLMALALRRGMSPETRYWLVGSLLYLIGTIGVTMAGNVPLNDALAVVKPDSAAGAALWAKYLNVWTWWNHVRTVAALLAAVLLTRSLCP